MNSSQLDQMNLEAFGARAKILQELQNATHDMKDDITQLTEGLSKLRVDGSCLQQGMNTFYRTNEDPMTVLVNSMQQLLRGEYIDKTSDTARLIRQPQVNPH